jgi:hypothetical protein
VSIIGAIVGFIEVPVVAYWSNVFNPSTVREIGIMHGDNQMGTNWNEPILFADRDARTLSLAVIAAYPALAAGSESSTGSLYFGRAGDNAGDTWPDGISEMLSDGHGGFADLKLIDGAPAICFYAFDGGNLWYMNAADSTGTSWDDPFIVASSGTVGEYCSMAVIGGTKPVIFYYDDTNDDLMAAYWVP